MTMKRPLVFYSVSLYLGCLFVLLFLDSILAAALVAAFFLIILFFTLEIKAFTINVLFFLFGIFSFCIYFNVSIQNPVEIRIVDSKNYYFIGDFKGRKIILEGKTKGLEEGQKITKVYGRFQKNFDIENGFIGNYYLTGYEYCKKDLVYYSYKFKKNLYEKFKNIIGKDRAALVMALCYGETNYINQDQMKNFQELGIIHAVSVSGFHMALIYEVLEFTVGLKMAVFVSLFYVFFTGMAAATMRSFIMILIFKLSSVFFKEYDSISSLSLAALILIAFKPYYIVNIGFDLSFLATLGILLYSKAICRKLYKLPEKLAVSVSLTLSSQIFSLPYIAFTIQNFSYGFILGNLFLIPLFSIIIVLGNGALCLYPVEILFKYICTIINFIFTVIDGGSIIALKLCPGVMYLKYEDGLMAIALFTAIVMYKKGYEKFRHIPAACVILMILRGYSFFTGISFINTDNGEAALIKRGFNKVMICNYNYLDANWIWKVKMQQSVDKIITNPHENFVYNLGNGSYLKVNENSKAHMEVTLNSKNKKFKFLLNKNTKDSKLAFDGEKAVFIPKMDIKDSSSYVIMFNMLFKLR
ncbi:ComEC/Rec2 family competence protein [Clostridium sp. WLY-B-L2]|uniref:ComEC/Rec2 family competence protein n=1 Tax=Clostridium aromativorans TaxID=2836848 RepID=A0ABS8N325_9CLOT|nr:ComEC/Rec2 family competence protein [Clostridium aromativorans]MCC9294206.1 ComEC/Rec2 family competence protein [Clostridium aromativorans]